MAEKEEKKSSRGFARFNQKELVEAARKGGVEAHRRGTAHEWSSEEARDAGRKGGLSRGKANR